MDDLFLILSDMIPHGRNNAISSNELSDSLGVGILQLNQMIRSMILNGVLIVHSLDGYYYPTNEDYSETWKFYSSIKDDSIYQALKKPIREYFLKIEKEVSHGY